MLSLPTLALDEHYKIMWKRDAMHQLRVKCQVYTETLYCLKAYKLNQIWQVLDTFFVDNTNNEPIVVNNKTFL